MPKRGPILQNTRNEPEVLVEVVAYDELEHVVLTRDFLNAPARYLKALLE